MPASADTLNRYGAAVEGLAAAFADLGPSVAAAEDDRPPARALDEAIDAYVSGSRALFGSLFGRGAGDAFATALHALGSWKDRIMRAAARLLHAAVDKVTALLGGTAGDQVHKWLDALLDPASVYERALGVPRLRDKAKTVLATAPDAAD